MALTGASMLLQAMIVCILFFSMDLSTALWTGIIVGMGYTMFVRAMYSQQVSAGAPPPRML